MKLLFIGLIFISVIGFWKISKKRDEFKPRTHNRKMVIQETGHKLSGILKNNKIDQTVSKSSTTAIFEKPEPTLTPEDREEVDAIEQNNEDRLLSTLADSGVNLDEISEAMNSVESAADLDREQYYEELVSNLPPKTREIMEDLIEKNMINSYQLKDFFDKYIGHDINPIQDGPRRYPGYERLTADSEEISDPEY